MKEQTIFDIARDIEDTSKGIRTKSTTKSWDKLMSLFPESEGQRGGQQEWEQQGPTPLEWAFRQPSPEEIGITPEMPSAEQYLQPPKPERLPFLITPLPNVSGMNYKEKQSAARGWLNAEYERIFSEYGDVSPKTLEKLKGELKKWKDFARFTPEVKVYRQEHPGRVKVFEQELKIAQEYYESLSPEFGETITGKILGTVSGWVQRAREETLGEVAGTILEMSRGGTEALETFWGKNAIIATAKELGKDYNIVTNQDIEDYIVKHPEILEYVPKDISMAEEARKHYPTAAILATELGIEIPAWIIGGGVLRSLYAATTGLPHYALAPLALPDIWAGELTGAVVKYGIVLPVTKGIPAVAKKSFESAIDLAIKRWATRIATEGRILPEAQSGLFRLMVKDRPWVIERATNHLLKQQAARRGVKVSVDAAVRDTIADIEARFLPKVTRTRMQADVMAMGGEPARPLLPGGKLPAGLKKPIESLSTAELKIRVKKASPYRKLYQAELDKRTGITPEVAPEVPSTEPGEPEAGLQPGMFGGVEVVRPVGKGRPTQISMEEQLKLQQLREAAQPNRIAEIQALLEKPGRLPKGQGTRPALKLELARLEAQSDIATLSADDLQSTIRQLQEEMSIREYPFHGGTRVGPYGGIPTTELDEMLKVYEAAVPTEVTPELEIVKQRSDLIEDLRAALVEIDVPGEAVAILPDGVTLTGREFRGVGAFQHLVEGLPPVGEWLDAGVIRIAWEEGNVLNIELNETITASQFSALNQEMQNAKSINIDISDYTGELTKTIEGTPNIVRSQLRELIAQPVAPEVPTGVTPVTPEVPVEPTVPAEPPVLLTAGEPPTQPPAPTIPELSGEPMPASWKGLFPELQDVQTVIDIATKPDIFRKIANLPIIRAIQGELNPSAVANTMAQKAYIARAVLEDEAENKAVSIMAYLMRKGTMKNVFGPVNSQGIITKGKLKGIQANEMVEFPQKYANKLTDRQKKWLELAQEIEQTKRSFLEAYGIEIYDVNLLEGQVYAGRAVVGKVGPTGEVEEVGYVGTGGARPGAKLRVEKTRFFPTIKEAQAVGYRYLPYDTTLNLNVVGALRRVANKKVADWVLTQVPWRTTAADTSIKLAAEAALNKARAANNLNRALSRAVRGERLPDVLIKSIATYFPEQAAQLKSLIPRIQAGEQTGSEVKRLSDTAKGMADTYSKDANRAVSARARSRERNMTPKYGEGMVHMPAFQGKIFTGPEAQAISRELNDLLGTKNPQLLQKTLNELAKPGQVARFVLLAGDFSPMLIQLIIDIGNRPLTYAKAGVGMVQGLADPAFIQAYMNEKRHVVNWYEGRLLSPLSTEWSEAFRQGWLSPGPIVRPAAEETLTAALAKTPFRVLRKGVRGALIPFQNAIEAGFGVAQMEWGEAFMHIATTPEAKAQVAEFINSLHGLTSSKRLGVSKEMRDIESFGGLAPRYNRAVAAMLFEASKGAVGAGGLRGRLSIIALTRGLIAVAAVATGLTLLLREKPEKIVDHLNYRHPDFMTWTVGNSRLGIGSKYRSVFRLIGQAAENPENLNDLSMENPLLRFVRGNLGPVPGTAIDILTGKNYIGEPTRDNWWDFTENVLSETFIPVWLQSTLLEGGDVENRTIRGFAEFVGGRSYPESVWDDVKRLRDKYASSDYNKAWEDLPKAYKGNVKRNHPDLVELEKKGEMEFAERGTEFEAWRTAATETAVKERHESLDKYASSLLRGQISKYEYDKTRTRIRAEYSGAMGVIWTAGELLDPKGEKSYAKWLAENQHPYDKAMDEYKGYVADMIEKSELPIDWDMIDARSLRKLQSFNKEIKDYIFSHKDDWIEDLPKDARRVEKMRLMGIEDESWWDDYRETEFLSTPETREPVGAGAGSSWDKLMELFPE